METVVRAMLSGHLVVQMEDYYLIVDGHVECKYWAINSIALNLLPEQVLILDSNEVECIARSFLFSARLFWTRERYDEEGFRKTIFVDHSTVVETYSNANVPGYCARLLFGRRVYE